MPAATPAASNPFAAVTDISWQPSNANPAEPQACRLWKSEEEIDVLHRLSSRTLAKVVLGAHDDRPVGERVVEDADLGAVRPLDASEGARAFLCPLALCQERSRARIRR